MSKNNINVNVFADSGYAVWTAPLGTAAPTVLPPTNPGAAFDEVGLLTAAGITEAHTLNETKIYDMAGSLVRIARNQEERPFTFSALEGNNIVDSLRYPGSSVTNTGGTAEVQTVTLTGTGTAGTWALTSPNYGTASGLAYNISFAALQTALQTAFGITIPLPTGSPGSSYVITFPVTAGNVGQLTATNNITGVTSITVATTTPGVTGVNSRGVGSGTGRNLRVFCIDLVDGSLHKRIVINNGEAVWTGTTTYSGSAAAEYQFTVQPYKDSSGLYYVILEDNSADAEAFA
jgi:hypothetical protein